MAASVQTRTRSPDTIYSAFEKSARQHWKRIALKNKGGRGNSYTYGEVLTIVEQLSLGLLRGEYTKKTEVGLLSENRPEWGIAYLAILAAGKTVVPIDAGLKGDEVSFIIKDTGLDIVFASGRFEDLLKSLISGFT